MSFSKTVSNSPEVCCEQDGTINLGLTEVLYNSQLLTDGTINTGLTEVLSDSQLLT